MRTGDKGAVVAAAGCVNHILAMQRLHRLGSRAVVVPAAPSLAQV